jgi:hypothetical protein
VVVPSTTDAALTLVKEGALLVGWVGVVEPPPPELEEPPLPPPPPQEPARVMALIKAIYRKNDKQRSSASIAIMVIRKTQCWEHIEQFAGGHTSSKRKFATVNCLFGSRVVVCELRPQIREVVKTPKKY